MLHRFFRQIAVPYPVRWEWTGSSFTVDLNNMFYDENLTHIERIYTNQNLLPAGSHCSSISYQQMTLFLSLEKTPLFLTALSTLSNSSFTTMGGGQATLRSQDHL